MQPCPVCNHSNRPTAHFCANCRAPLLLQNIYRITRLLGSGGYGAVYQAEQLQLGGVLCAIKELQPDPKATPQQAQQAAAQFHFEATLLAGLNHPALPRVTNFFTEGNRYYLVMDYVEGETLEERLERNRGPLPEAQVMAWTNELCDVLTYLHTHKPSPVIHRDIKPANVKITPEGTLKLIDFGISKILAKGTGDAARAVSPPYSPFEQYGKGVSTDARSDIYALGVTLYQLLTNQLPPEAPDRTSEATIPLRQWNPSIMLNTESVVLKAMAEKPADRFQNAAEMKQALTVTMPYTPPVYAPPVTPMPQPVPYAPTQPATRWRTINSTQVALLAGIATLVVCVLIAISMVINYQMQANATATAVAMAMRTSQAATTTAQAQATLTAQAQATLTAQANATATAQAQATMTAQANATATAQAQATLTAQAKAAATAQSQATMTAQANATAIARARTPQATATATVFITTQSPFKDLTFGRGDVNSQGACRVSSITTDVSQLALVDDRYFYFAMPFQSSDIGKKIVWSISDPNGNSFVDPTERQLQASDQSCFWQGFSVDAVSSPGRYVLQITYSGALVYQTGFTIEYADTSARRPQRSPFGQISFGRGGVSTTTCQPSTVTDQVNQSDLKDDEWFYLASPYTMSDVGNTFTYTVYWPSGSVAYDHVANTIRNQFWLCDWRGFSLGNTPDKGKYHLVIEYKSRIVLDKYFYIQ